VSQPLTVNKRACFCDECRQERAEFCAGLNACHATCPYCRRDLRQLPAPSQVGDRLIQEACCDRGSLRVMPLHTQCRKVQP
jgi:coenzyme F420-reducing hydrogenase gamma subunit